MGSRANATIVASIIAAAAAITAACFTFWNGSRVTRLASQLQREEKADDRRADAEKVLSRFREPLLRAAYDLQSRIYNIAAQSLLSAYMVHGSRAEASYVVNNTLYVIAQFFAWNEIIRREVQFLDLGDQDRTRRLAELQDHIVHLWLTDLYSSSLRVFAGDQRAIGERLMCATTRGLDCLGYADFLDLFREHPERVPQLTQLKTDLLDLSRTQSHALPRLLILQNALIDLIDFLDPDGVRCRKDHREKLPLQAVTSAPCLIQLPK